MKLVRSEGPAGWAVGAAVIVCGAAGGDEQHTASCHCYVRRQTMHAISNGMSAGELSGAAWRKSQRSNSQGACVEIARISADIVAMRNSRDPQGPALICQRDAIVALMTGLRGGAFDDLVG
jgi:uncharacterized protein DUF397